ncbi:hypothetical protein [Kribbella sp. NBC_00889]|uniref:hypothetical protein n=1 Tax=Kribbella sp. NBC_00889 TaxID=2975974 RepID=UPI003870A2DF|nr:hypothetical protein OG817_23530 [Kribbella sp. NBC_00889]
MVPTARLGVLRSGQLTPSVDTAAGGHLLAARSGVAQALRRSAVNEFVVVSWRGLGLLPPLASTTVAGRARLADSAYELEDLRLRPAAT